MESQPQNPKFRINPENFHPCIYVKVNIHSHLRCTCILIKLSHDQTCVVLDCIDP